MKGKKGKDQLNKYIILKGLKYRIKLSSQFGVEGMAALGNFRGLIAGKGTLNLNLIGNPTRFSKRDREHIRNDQIQSVTR